MDNFAEELLVGYFKQFVERRNVWWTKTAAGAAAEECYRVVTSEALNLNLSRLRFRG